MSNRLRELRARSGLAQQGLAARAGVSPSMIVAIERWGHVPGASVRERIAAAVDARPEEIWPPQAELASSVA